MTLLMCGDRTPKKDENRYFLTVFNLGFMNPLLVRDKIKKDMIHVDAYTPEEIAHRVESASQAKATRDSWTALALAILAGAFIALGAALFTLALHDGSLPFGPGRLVGGLAFSLGLILVVVAGAELFTGNNLLVMAAVDGKISIGQLLRNWAVVYIGNLLGSLAIVGLIHLSGHWDLNGGLVGDKALSIARSKLALTWMEAFTRGILCNILVCLAVWICLGGRSVTDRILGLVMPVTAFVALGFEHSVANMYFLPAGWLLAPASDPLSFQAIWIDNLIPVTLGNIVGGGGVVAGVYAFIYLRRSPSAS